MLILYYEIKKKKLCKLNNLNSISFVLQEADKREAEEQIRIQNILQGNPLLSYGGGPSAPKVNQKVKRRWNDDVVFKNCARTEPEKSTTFINDCIRSDFHRKFMDKYIK